MRAACLVEDNESHGRVQVVGVIETVPGLHKQDEVFWFILETL